MPPSGGNPWGDILEQMMGGGRDNRAGGREMPVPGADNPLGKIFQDMMRGGMGAQEPERTGARGREDAGGRSQTGGLEDLFGKMFDTGRQGQNEYQKGIENIFDQFLGGGKR